MPNGRFSRKTDFLAEYLELAGFESGDCNMLVGLRLPVKLNFFVLKTKYWIFETSFFKGFLSVCEILILASCFGHKVLEIP
jgi:hypothetical protein